MSTRLKRVPLIVAALAALGLVGTALAGATAGEDDAREDPRASAVDDDRDDAGEPSARDDAGNPPSGPLTAQPPIVLAPRR